MDETPTPDTPDREDGEAPTTIAYAHRPKPFAADLDMKLTETALIAERGRSRQEFPLASIERIRLSYTPRNTAKHVFRCEVRASDGKSVRFDNLSWLSLIQTARFDGDFRRFVAALVERAAAARKGRPLALEAGIGMIRYRIMQLAGFGIVIALTAAAMVSAAKASYLVGIASFGLGGYLAWWLLEFLGRNRPQKFSPGAIPPGVLPDPPGAARRL